MPFKIIAPSAPANSSSFVQLDTTCTGSCRVALQNLSGTTVRVASDSSGTAFIEFVSGAFGSGWSEFMNVNPADIWIRSNTTSAAIIKAIIVY